MQFCLVTCALALTVCVYGNPANVVPESQPNTTANLVTMARSPNLTTPLQTPAAKRSLSAKEMKWKKEVERFSASLFTVMKHAMLLTGRDTVIIVVVVVVVVFVAIDIFDTLYSIPL